MSYPPEQKTFATVNALLKTATPAGAYAMGLICAAAWECGSEPSIRFLEVASKYTSLDNLRDFLAAVRAKDESHEDETHRTT